MRVRAILVMTLCILAACAPGKAVTNQVEPTSTPPAPPEATLTVTLPPVATLSPPKRASPTAHLTHTPLPTTTSAPTATIEPLTNLGTIAIYHDDNSIWFMKADLSETLGTYTYPGANRIGFTSGFSWSPDGKWLAFSTSTYPNIYLLSPQTLQAEKITNFPGDFKMNPDWSPDGRQIAFSGLLDAQQNTFDIFSMNADGTNLQRLTLCSSDCQKPDWSPSGEYLAYVNGTDIYIMKANGEESRRIASGGINDEPLWSPDGQRIAFTRSLTYDSTPYLYLMNPDGSGLKAVTDEPFRPRQFSWSPDGKYIIFDNFPVEGPFATLWLLDVQSGAVRDLSSGGGYYAPAWVPAPASASDTGSLEPSNEVKQLEDCTSGWSRLRAGGQARVMGAASDPPNRVRSGPSKSDDVMGQIAPGTLLDVLEGPLCADGLVFWKVRSASPALTGWTAEGDQNEYYLEPAE